MGNVSLKVNVQFTPRDDFGRYIDVKVVPAILTAVGNWQERVAARARELAAKRTGFMADPENLKAIEATVGNKTVVGAVVSLASYSGYVEYGTGIRGEGSPGKGPYPYNQDWPGMVAQPFLRPALDGTKEEARAGFGRDMSAGLRV